MFGVFLFKHFISFIVWCNHVHIYSADTIWYLKPLIRAYHEVAWKQFLQKLRLFVLHRLNDILIITRDIEQRSTGPGA